MGVRACNRKGCDKVMCTRYSHKYGYICDSCFDELVALGVSPEEFMNSDKSIDKPTWDYDKIFPSTEVISCGE